MIKIIVLACCVLAPTYGASIQQVTYKRLLPNYPHGRIVGGEDTDISQVPYQCAFELLGLQFCGCTIITPNFTLTAGQCCEGMFEDQVQVRVGTSTHESGGITIGVKKIHKNPEYNASAIDNDVCLLQLTQPVTLGANTALVPLVDSGEDPAAGQIVLVSGWGATFEGGTASSQLQSVRVPVVDEDTCKEVYGSRITDGMFCCGEKGMDACAGDTGGPAVAEGKLVGVVSWGLGCGHDHYPGVYVNIAKPEIRAFIKTIANV